MRDLSRSQLLVYAAIGVALLLVGARWVRSSDGGEAAAGIGPAAAESGSEQGLGGGLAIERGGGGVVVHVAGGVRDPGVYRLPDGSRVADAVERAGGPAHAGIPDQINLAALLADGQQVVVPERVPGPTAAASGVGATEGPIGLGTATIEQLDTIEGIGPVTAGDIVEFRDEHGGVGSVEDLDQISGIGPATMEALRESLQP
jgi:competence protein ComEA